MAELAGRLAGRLLDRSLEFDLLDLVEVRLEEIVFLLFLVVVFDLVRAILGRL